MKLLGTTLASALIAGQIGAMAQPALAAESDRRNAFADSERGAFAGVRLKLQLGGAAGTTARAALTLTPTVHSRFGARSSSSLAEGLELGISPGSKPELTLAGQRLDRISLLGERPGGERADMSDLAKVAIVVGVVVVVGGLAFAHVVSEASCFHGGDDSDC